MSLHLLRKEKQKCVVSLLKNSQQFEMAPTWFDRNLHPNTHEETEKILSKLRTRKITARTGDELAKFFFKLNAENAQKPSKNAPTAPGVRQDPQMAPTYGPIPGFPPGSWWGIRMDLSRDQVHRPFDKSVDEGPPGASSLCTPHSNPANDLDLGDYLTFTTPSGPTPCHPLVRSCQSQIPVRLVRGYNLTNKFSPKTGYRYDGLYLVLSFWQVGDESRKDLRFALARLNCQGAPPWEPSPFPSSPPKKTRNKSRATQRCHMDCCKSKSLIKDRRAEALERLPLEKQSKESAIVMRHVSRKCESAPGVESPKLGTSRAPCKLQNTNISIRTDLYDSSPNAHDVKKTPMTFCRIYKSSKPVKGLATSAGVLNLNTFGPGARDRVQESQIQMRSGVGRHSPVLSTSSRSEGSHELTSAESRGKIEGPRKEGEAEDPRRSSEELLSKKGKGEASGELDPVMEAILLPKVKADVGVVDAEMPETTAKPCKTHRTLYSLRSTSGSKKQTDVKANLKRSVLPKAKGEIRKEGSHKGKSAKPSVQGFSKASRKRQSELAKLAIDANFVAKSRGPRTRRFPYAMRGFSKRRDNLRHLKGRSKPDLSKKRKLIKRGSTSEGKPSGIPRSRALRTAKAAEKMEQVRELKQGRGLEENEGKKMEKSTQKRERKSFKMVDAVVQCSLQRDASTSVDFEELSGDRGVRSKWGSLEDVKSEASDDDLMEIVHRNISVQTTQEGEILRPNCVRRSLEASARLGGGLSAFVPVNMTDVDFRVARLRSIGFKPIHPCGMAGFESQAFSEYRQGSSKGSGASVARRDVNEQYKKYTTEENNVVGYMDDELRYQDIEEESATKGILGKGKRVRKRRSGEAGEGPWHGWKKFAQL
ncbi:uncharacterized protein LOC107043110 [Diachasma alloeum]|uniref:uncharacterized protein LOC107043110 n=1 Tax=Diachasma alloeum TaxID=454923 RepID=UPI0007382811|nr:uncharacterized protein LOC107043110 [Diachasma alloeum]